ncbi:MAG: YihA family ribosome biogenesis GTP-binding protein [Bacteroidetes bacterium]|uniref:Probable GTP-binding protein EngB n=1 Tax=Candidatus Merdivivens pullistercoris TaxID=2840873 RepID=A0A9D9I2M6_9BACT|nr:YihA family ribosome biogenesis GTP-binding protein [Candidatus Merdivivens pullistercoris]
MKIKEATYSKSSIDGKQNEGENLAEFAFIGRSNVGKSSLINMLCGNRKLALTSSTPGKTKLVNHFLINGAWYIVDLPGYGFAKVSKGERDNLNRMIWRYITGSENMVLLFVLLDSRHELLKNDLEFLMRLGEKGIPFSIVFTKADKSGKRALENRVASIKQKLLEYWEELPPCFITSSADNTGKEEMLDYMGEILESIGQK